MAFCACFRSLNVSKFLSVLLLGASALSPLSALTNPSTEKEIDIMTTPATTQDPVFLIKTSLGDILVRLYATKAPLSTENFRKYVSEGHYNGTIFHRIIDGFMIQGGGFTPDMRQKQTNAPIASEAHKEVKNRRGTIAMARTSDPHSATSQFFINVVDNDGLNRTNSGSDPDGYAVFGEVVQGMDVVDAIRKVPTTNRMGHANVPVTPVMIESVTEQK